MALKTGKKVVFDRYLFTYRSRLEASDPGLS